MAKGSSKRRRERLLRFCTCLAGFQLKLSVLHNFISLITCLFLVQSTARVIFVTLHNKV